VVTFGLFSATGVTINLITLLALPVVLIVGLANSCHFLSKSSSAAVAENDVAEAVSATVRRVGPPFFVSSLTTAIALLSLSFNDIGPIADLGRIAAAALLIVFVLVMLAAPLSLRWYLQHSTWSWRQSRAFQGLSRALFTDRQLVSVVLLVLMLASALSIPFLTMKSDPRALFPDDAPFSRTLRFFEQEFFVFAPLRVVVAVEAAAGDGLFALSQAGEIRALLESGAGVRQVSMRPGTQDAATFVLTALLDSDAALGPAIKRIDERRAALPAGVRVMYSSAPLVYNDIDRRASDSLLRSLGWSVALIFGAMLLVFRSALAVVGTMLANAVPLALVCGFVWLSGNPLNLVTVFVFLVALGVIVDDAIHILFARGAGDRLTGSSIEFSVLLTTAMLCLGLLLCQLSDFPTTREFSAYCALALVAAVISNLTVLPWLLDRLGSRRHTE